MAEIQKNAANPPAEETAKEVEDKKQSKGSQRLKLKHFSAAASLASFILSLPLLATAIWLIYMGAYDCEAVLKLPGLQVGISVTLLAVFFICNLALIFLKSRIPLAAATLAVVPLFVMFIVGLGFAGAYQLESGNIAASPMWLRKKINDNIKWEQLKSCIYRTQACQSYDHLPPMLQDGCCQAPMSCEMEAAVNGTSYWEKQGEVMMMSPPSNIDKDCDRWTDDPTVLCYDCDSCKRGVVRTFASKWSSLGVFLVTMSLLLIVSHISVFVTTTLEHLSS